MNTLAFDTCCGQLSIALFKDETLIQSYLEVIPNQQSKYLITKIKEIMVNNDLALSQLDNIIITLGPGSFTGVRIGLAAAQGMTVLNKTKLIGISTMEALSYLQNGDVIAVLEAGRGHYYAQLFSNHIATSDIWLAGSEEILKFSQSHKIIGTFHEQQIFPDSRYFIKALKMYNDKKEIAPIYIREPDAKISNKIH